MPSAPYFTEWANEARDIFERDNLKEKSKTVLSAIVGELVLLVDGDLLASVEA